MSHLVSCKSCMKEKDSVVSALKKLGVPGHLIQVAQSGQELDLQGYLKGHTAKVEILVDKSFHNGYGPFGFAKGEDGTYQVYVDDMDDTGALARATETKTFSKGVEQWYSALQAQKALKKQGLSTKIKQDGQKLVVLAKG